MRVPELLGLTLIVAGSHPRIPLSILASDDLPKAIPPLTVVLEYDPMAIASSAHVWPPMPITLSPLTVHALIPMEYFPNTFVVVLPIANELLPYT